MDQLNRDRRFLLQAAIGVAISGSFAGPAIARPAGIAEARLVEVAGSVFREEGVAGTFVLYDENADSFARFNGAMARQRLVPASTFKIVNSLIFLEERMVASVDETIAWDGVEREFDAWNRDQTLRSAFRNSTVWSYQKLARQTGPTRLQHYVDAIGYGNGVIGPQVDEFWLDGSLLVSPEEQIHLLRRLHSGNLPFSAATMEAVKDIMVARRTDRFVLRAKTGLALRVDPPIGWYVGTLETCGNCHHFALAVELGPNGEGRDRVGMSLKILSGLGLLGE